MPIFAPPDSLSPAAMRYVVKKGLDNRGFAAALVDAAVKGHVRLVEDDGGFFGRPSGVIERPLTATAEPLDPVEQDAIDALVSPGETLAMDNDNHATFSAANKGALGGLCDAFRRQGVQPQRRLGVCRDRRVAAHRLPDRDGHPGGGRRAGIGPVPASAARTGGGDRGVAVAAQDDARRSGASSTAC